MHAKNPLITPYHQSNIYYISFSSFKNWYNIHTRKKKWSRLHRVILEEFLFFSFAFQFTKTTELSDEAVANRHILFCAKSFLSLILLVFLLIRLSKMDFGDYVYVKMIIIRWRVIIAVWNSFKFIINSKVKIANGNKNGNYWDPST